MRDEQPRNNGINNHTDLSLSSCRPRERGKHTLLGPRNTFMAPILLNSESSQHRWNSAPTAPIRGHRHSQDGVVPIYPDLPRTQSCRSGPRGTLWSALLGTRWHPNMEANFELLLRRSIDLFCANDTGWTSTCGEIQDRDSVKTDKIFSCGTQ